MAELKDRDKTLRYRKMMKAKKQFLLSFFVFIPAGAVLASLLGLSDEILFAPLIFLTFLTVALWFNFFFRGFCPWCEGQFYVRSGDVMNVFDIFFKKHCLNCGKPDDEDCI
ncbi:hypothetical protein A11A3_00690 [Alcanivorax hongdengensis A-11-3]|uniref:Uncharacterized protein n=1 Tax=Alcanivorax hongdengensis A-11-3 TaxID=1177179 RepID=L0WG38_9GAMM|nr:hypothetical protein [Alcanivorax hongdengensis]EKF75966.1 hypothetical protein A11A3_00690 [Alcanivorax hongdengensis A-11-3]